MNDDGCMNIYWHWVENEWLNEETLARRATNSKIVRFKGLS